MPTLSKTKREAQLIIKWGGISLAIILIFLIGIKLATSIKNSLTPPPPPAATFGKLPQIPFPSQEEENIHYSLDTLTGFLPKFSDRAKVYRITTNPPTLLALNNTQAKVAQIGFKSNGVRIAEDIYQWVDQESDLQRRIIINIFLSDFTLSSPYLVTPSLQMLGDSDNLNGENKAVNLAVSFLSGISLLPNDLDQEKTRTTLYSIKNSELIPTSKISNAKIAKVDFFQKDKDSLPIYYERGTSSTISFLIGKENDRLKAVDARYFHKNISEIFSEYSIKSIDTAFTELKKGKAYISSKPENVTEIAVKNVLMGYYIGETQQNFLMPVFIFIDNNDFIAYVSAIKDEWISN